MAGDCVCCNPAVVQTSHQHLQLQPYVLQAAAAQALSRLCGTTGQGLPASPLISQAEADSGGHALQGSCEGGGGGEGKCLTSFLLQGNPAAQLVYTVTVSNPHKTVANLLS